MKEFFDEFYAMNKKISGNKEIQVKENKNTYEYNKMMDCNQWLISRFGLAQAYVPYQEMGELLSSSQSLACGTVFPSLVKPYVKKW